MYPLLDIAQMHAQLCKKYFPHSQFCQTKITYCLHAPIARYSSNACTVISQTRKFPFFLHPQFCQKDLLIVYMHPLKCMQLYLDCKNRKLHFSTSTILPKKITYCLHASIARYSSSVCTNCKNRFLPHP